MRDAPIVGWLALLLAFVYACDGLPLAGSDDAGPVFDAAGEVDHDGGPDPRTGVDAGAPASPESFDCFVETGGLSCSVDACQAVDRACCVGTVSRDCCDPEASIELIDFATCEVGPAANCSSLALFELLVEGGEPAEEPFIVAHGDAFALAPGGQSREAGLRIGPVLHPRAERVELRARVGVGPGACAGVDCVDAMAIALSPLGTDGVGRPSVGVVISATRGEVSALLAGEVVERAALPAGDATYVLRAGPDGLVDLFLELPDGTRVYLLEGAHVGLLPSARVLIYGRSPNASGEYSPVRLESLRLSREACDFPAARHREAGPVLDPNSESWGGRPRAIGGLGVLAPLSGSDQPLFAVSLDGEIHLGEWDGDRIEPRDPLAEPALIRPNLPWANDGVYDPWLERGDDGALRLIFVGRAGGAGTIASVDAAADGSFDPESVAVWLAPDDEIVSFDAPSRPPGSSELLVRARYADGRTALRLYPDGVEEAGRDLQLVAPAGAERVDEVAAPSWWTDGELHRIHYAVRRGTRWSIALAVSSDDQNFRDLGPILPPSGQGFDALGTRHPLALDTLEGLLLFYVGTDGAHERVGRAAPLLAR